MCNRYSYPALVILFLLAIDVSMLSILSQRITQLCPSTAVRWTVPEANYNVRTAASANNV